MADVDVLHMEKAAEEVGAKVVFLKGDKQMRVTTGKKKEGKQKELFFEVALPATLEDAIKIEGPRGVWGRYLRALAVDIQAKKRLELGDEGEKKERRRASYLEEVGL